MRKEIIVWPLLAYARLYDYEFRKHTHIVHRTYRASLGSVVGRWGKRKSRIDTLSSAGSIIWHFYHFISFHVAIRWPVRVAHNNIKSRNDEIIITSRSSSFVAAVKLELMPCNIYSDNVSPSWLFFGCDDGVCYNFFSFFSVGRSFVCFSAPCCLTYNVFRSRCSSSNSIYTRKHSIWTVDYCLPHPNTNTNAHTRSHATHSTAHLSSADRYTWLTGGASSANIFKLISGVETHLFSACFLRFSYLFSHKMCSIFRRVFLFGSVCRRWVVYLRMKVCSCVCVSAENARHFNWVWERERLFCDRHYILFL